MKILIVGATGRVGQALLKKLENSNHEVYAAARQPEKLNKIGSIQLMVYDLSWTVDKQVEKLQAMDAIIDVAGSSGGSLLEVDLFGAVNLMRAAEEAGVKRFILLSTVFALQPEKWTTPGFMALRDYYIAKHFADVYLTENTTLDYTILQPGYLEEEAGTGKVTLNDNQSAPVSIEDVAETLALLPEAKNTIGKVIIMHHGETAIAEAIASLS